MNHGHNTGENKKGSMRRIVVRYLEHARIFVFHNSGEPQYYMGSGYWMNRNLHSRIEVIFPVYDLSLQKELEAILQLQLKDNCKAALFSSAEMPGAADNITVARQADEVAVSAQQEIYSYVKTAGKS